MTRESLRTLETIHGWLGWASILALAIPAVLLVRARAPRRALVVACTAVATLTGALGGYLYSYYTPMLKRAVFIASPRMGVLMERKEHLAVVALSLAWAGCALHGADANDAGKTARSRAAHLCFVVSATLAFVIAVMGAFVASTRTF